MSLSQGMVFVFSNTNNIITDMLGDNDLNIKPAKFACLNLPQWQNTAGASQTFYADPAEFGATTTILDPNLLVPALLQNYVDNLSLYATNSMTEDYETFVESAVWKWLQRMYSFKPVVSAAGSTVYVQSEDYKPIVTYIGDTIDLGTNIVNGVNYTEMFMHIPANAQPVNAKWDSVQYAGLQNIPAFPEGSDYVENALGLTAGDATFVKALYDLSDGVETQKYDISKATDRLKLQFNNIEKTAGDIEWNAIAIWADVWRTSDPTNVKRVLHSIFFVNKFEIDSEVGGTYILKGYTKQAPSPDNSTAAFAFRLCTRMSTCNVALSSIEVQAIDGVSLDMYINSLQTLVDQSDRITKLERKQAELESLVNRLVLGTGATEDAASTIDILLDRINEMRLYVSNDKLLDLFMKISDQLASASSDKQIINQIIVQQAPVLEKLS